VKKLQAVLRPFSGKPSEEEGNRSEKQSMGPEGKIKHGKKPHNEQDQKTKAKQASGTWRHLAEYVLHGNGHH